MKKNRNREINIFGVSFLDVLANTIGGLAFLLVLAVIMIRVIVNAPPQITTEQLPEAYHNREYAVWLGARDGGGKFKWSFGEGIRPQGLEIDSVMGKLYGEIKLANPSGNFEKFKFEVICETTADVTEDTVKVDTTKFQLTVNRNMPVNSIPLRILTNDVLPKAYLGQPYPLVFAAEGGQAPYSWTLQDNFPEGLLLNQDGMIVGQSTRVGKYSFKISVVTQQGERSSKRFSLDISELHPPPPPPPPLAVLTENIPEAISERNFQIWLAAQGGRPPYRWTVLDSSPHWLHSNENATAFEGRPGLTDIGTNAIVFRVTDASGNSLDSNPIDLKVLPPVIEQPPPLCIKTTLLPNARVAQRYMLAIAVEGGFPPYEWQYDGAASNSGLSFLPDDGIIQGTPTTIGRFTFPIRVVDRSDAAHRVDLPLLIHPPEIPVEILTTGIPDGRVDLPYSFEFSARGGYSPYTWEITAGTLPPGLKLNYATGRISGKPVFAGRWKFELQVYDAKGQLAQNRFISDLSILTRQGARQLIIKTEVLPALMIDEFTNLTLAAEGGTEPYTWQIISGLPNGMQHENGRLIGKPSDSGESIVEIILNDSAGMEAQASLPLIVKHVVPFWLTVLLTLLLAIMVVVLYLLLRAYSKTKPVVIQPLKILSKSIPNARASCDYSVQLACLGGESPYHWKIIEGELPPGLKLESNGRIYGMPFKGITVKNTMEVSFTIEVKDKRGNKASQQL